MRIVPYEIGDVVTLSALMLPSILGFQISLLVFSLTFDSLLPRWAFYTGIAFWLGLLLAGFIGQVTLILLTTLLTTYLVFQKSSIEGLVEELSVYAPSIIAASIFLIALHAFSDARTASLSKKLPVATGVSNVEGASVVRSLSKGYIIRDRENHFYFVSAESYNRIALTTADSEPSE